MSLDLLDANLYLPVPGWMHDHARSTGASALSWAGRNDCPRDVASSILHAFVQAGQSGSLWSAQTDAALVAAIVTGRGDIDPLELAEDANRGSLAEMLTLLAANDPGCLAPILAESHHDWYSKDYTRFAKNLVALRKSEQGGKPVSMTQLNWTTSRGRMAPDVLISRCAHELVRNGTRQRLIFALKEIAGRSPRAARDLGYLCRHTGPHNSDDCLYRMLGGFDANAIASFARQWIVPWLDTLDDEPRRVAMAMIASGAKGTSLDDVGTAATVVLD